MYFRHFQKTSKNLKKWNFQSTSKKPYTGPKSDIFKKPQKTYFFLGFWDPEDSREPQETQEGSQRLPEAPRGSQRFQRLPDAPRGSQRLPEAPRGSQGVPEDPRGSQKLPGDPRGSRGLPEAPRGRWTRLWEIHKIAIRGTIRSQPPRRSSWQARL